MSAAFTGAVLSSGAGEYHWGTAIIISIVIGLICGFMRALALKGQLTSVYKNNSASDYTRKGSFKVTGKRDIFLGSKTETVDKPKQEAPQQNK